MCFLSASDSCSFSRSLIASSSVPFLQFLCLATEGSHFLSGLSVSSPIHLYGHGVCLTLGPSWNYSRHVAKYGGRYSKSSLPKVNPCCFVVENTNITPITVGLQLLRTCSCTCGGRCSLICSITWSISLGARS